MKAAPFPLRLNEFLDRALVNDSTFVRMIMAVWGDIDYNPPDKNFVGIKTYEGKSSKK